AILEAGASFERERVDLKTKRVASGGDFTAVTRKGYVPALVLDSGEVLTENIAVLDWIAAQTLDRLEAILPNPQTIANQATNGVEASDIGLVPTLPLLETEKTRWSILATRQAETFSLRLACSIQKSRPRIAVGS